MRVVPADSPDPGSAARLLGQVRAGSSSAFDTLVPLVYEQLHGLAHAQRRRWKGDATLNTTVLVHEAYLKLAATDAPDWKSRAHFLSVAARAMRQVLLDHARGKQALKRGGDRVRVTLEEQRLEELGVRPEEDPSDAILALEDALGRLEDRDRRQARVVECRFFGGMTIRETAEALGVSTATVERDWAMAKAWLYRQVERELAG